MNFSCPDNECHFKAQKIKLSKADSPCGINQGAYGKWQQITLAKKLRQLYSKETGVPGVEIS